MQSETAPWSATIRRQVLQLIALLVSLVLIGAGYDIWSHESIEHIERKTTRNHLLTTSHYLKAMEELRNIQNHHAMHSMQSMHHGEVEDIRSSLQMSDSQHDSKHYLVHQRINQALELEQEIADPRFNALSARLKQQIALFEVNFKAYQAGQAGDAVIIADSARLLTTLEQLVRLHRIARDLSLEQLHTKEHQQDVAFYILLSLMLLTGLLVSYRSLKTINRIIKRQQKSEERIKHQAHYDNLTGLPNRFLALDRLSVMVKTARRSGKKVAVLFIDLDHFKKVNDMLGHVRGDNLLIEAARRIRRSVREADTVGRLGGDEFIVLIGDLDATEEVNPIAENLIQQIGRAFHFDGREIVLSASIGVSVFPDDGAENFELIRKADSAMYHSKELGRNTFSFFTEQMNQNISRQLSLEGQMHGALERDEFEVYYQQKVDIESGRIIGAEALLRWHNHELGFVSPDEFIPIAEQTGLIVPIGEFVLNQALKMTHEWQRDLHPEFKVAVNLSPRQFRDPGLVDKISRILHESGVSSRDLELEITEGVLMSEYAHTDRALADLSRLGITIAMDDFGTGYSSLSYLRDYPFDVIKIDRCFIDDIDSNSTCKQLNHAAISMAHALNLRVVAEGVETSSQLATLEELQCDIAQGYYFGKPVPAEHMGELLRDQRKRERSANIVDIGQHADASPQAS